MLTSTAQMDCPEDTARHSNPCPSAADTANALLIATGRRAGTGFHLEPFASSEHDRAHVVSIDRGDSAVVSAVLADGLGEAVIARLAMMASLDLSVSDAQTGHCRFQHAGHTKDLFVSIELSSQSTAKVWMLAEPGTPALERDPVQLPEVLPPGTVVGNHRIVEVLGYGGMGIVYRARHDGLQLDSAIKVLRRCLLDESSEAVSRFFLEAQAAARIRHEGIVDVSDVSVLPDGRPYLVMDLLDGCSLEQLIEDEGNLEPSRAIRIARLTAEALHAAHEVGIVHMDLAPANIFILGTPGNERIKIVDFGTAHLIGSDDEDAEPADIIVGTPFYIAPEQARGLRCDGRADLYTLGVVLFEMVSGQVPFHGNSVAEIVEQHVFDDAPRLTSPEGKLPRDLVTLVGRLLAKSASDRYATAASLAKALADIGNKSAFAKWISL